MFNLWVACSFKETKYLSKILKVIKKVHAICQLAYSESLHICPPCSEPGKVEKGFDCCVLHAVNGAAGPFHHDTLQGQAR